MRKVFVCELCPYLGTTPVASLQSLGYGIFIPPSFLQAIVVTIAHM